MMSGGTDAQDAPQYLGVRRCKSAPYIRRADASDVDASTSLHAHALHTCTHRAAPHAWPTFTMFVAGLPRGIAPSSALQRSLMQFFAQWVPVVCIKLITHSCSGQLKCVFAEFASEGDALKALHGARLTPFYHACLRLEPARGDRTLRFTLRNAGVGHINASYIWVPGTPSALGARQMYRPQCTPDFPLTHFTRELIHDLTSHFGEIDLVMEKTLSENIVFDVVFEHRNAAYAALHALVDVAPLSNLHVEWCMSAVSTGGRVASLPSDRCVVREAQYTYVHCSLPYLNYHGPIRTPMKSDVRLKQRTLAPSTKHNMNMPLQDDSKSVWPPLECELHSSSPNTVHVPSVGPYTSPTALYHIFSQFGALHVVSMITEGQASITYALAHVPVY